MNTILVDQVQGTVQRAEKFDHSHANPSSPQKHRNRRSIALAAARRLGVEVGEEMAAFLTVRFGDAGRAWSTLCELHRVRLVGVLIGLWGGREDPGGGAPTRRRPP